MHQRRISFVVVLLVTSIAGAAAAQEPAEPKPEAPPARTGFQIAVRQGIAIPLGDVQKDSPLGDYLAPQYAISTDIGGKIIPNLFIGGYLGLGFGGAGGKSGEACDKANRDCAGISARAGAQVQYHIIPDGKLNPWVGYGIGYESAVLGASGFNQSASGIEFARLMAGLDIRISRIFGVGPFVDFSIGQYSKYEASGFFGKVEGDIENKALHQWITLGAKFTFFP